MTMTLAEIIKQYRKDSGLSLRDLAAVTGISAATICRIESGEENPASKTVEMIMSWIERGKKLPRITSLHERLELIEKRLEVLESK